MQDQQTTIWEELGVAPMPAERQKPLPRAARTTRDGTELTPVPGNLSLLLDPEGNAVRIVHAHSREKARKVGFYAEIVTGAMTGKWPSLWWVELHAGPGKLFHAGTRELLGGSPLDALGVAKPYDGYVFVEYDSICAAALRARTAGMPNVHVIEGDCKSETVHDQIRTLVPPNALVVMYADPEDLDDLDFETLRFFTKRYRHLDWLINFPRSGVLRYLAGGGDERAAPLLGTVHPAELLKHCTDRTRGPTLAEFYKRQLEALGHTCRYETIFLEGKNVPYYDLFLATKDPTGRAVDFFEKACGIKASGQRSFDFSTAS
jgi:three-Cys-motif partner protein